MNDEIKPLLNLRRIFEYGPLLAKAKAERMYLEEFRKTKKALLMQAAESIGHKTAAVQEREAYAHPEYVQLLDALKTATEEEELMRWNLVRATTAIEVWRSQEASARVTDRSAA